MSKQVNEHLIQKRSTSGEGAATNTVSMQPCLVEITFMHTTHLHSKYVT